MRGFRTKSGSACNHHLVFQPLPISRFFMRGFTLGTVTTAMSGPHIGIDSILLQISTAAVLTPKEVTALSANATGNARLFFNAEL